MNTIKKLKKIRASRKTLVRKLDKLVSEIVIRRDGRCVICHTKEKLTCGHLFSRVAYSTRWDLLNCHAQCWPHNFRHEFDPLPYIDWFRKNYGSMALNKLHKKYVTPHPLKDWELEELYNFLLSKFRKM